jgi:hypothetical protein
MAVLEQLLEHLAIIQFLELLLLLAVDMVDMPFLLALVQMVELVALVVEEDGLPELMVVLEHQVKGTLAVQVILLALVAQVLVVVALAQ